MQKLVQGIHNFQAAVFGPKHDLFARAASEAQRPLALFITCSDSRIQPDLMLGCDPGEVFILRNAGNLVPPHGASNGGEAATIEYAVAALKVPAIIVCGHSGCGAMRALIQPADLAGLPQMTRWLTHAEATGQIIKAQYGHLSDRPLWTATAEENVLVQLENLRTHPVVAAGLAAGTLKLHGWMFKMETGEVFAYDPARGQFLPLAEATPEGAPARELHGWHSRSAVAS
jgi:carbonic anhydrase